MSRIGTALKGTLLAAALAAGAASARTENVRFEGDHGMLSAAVQSPAGLKRYPVVLLLHGFTSSKDDFVIRGLADELEARGIASLRFDFNGHGESEGRFEDMTIPNETEDAKKALSYAASLPGVTGVAVAGHSQGGVVAAMLAGELGNGKIRAAVLLSPAAMLQDEIRNGRWFEARFDPSNLPDRIMALGHPVGREYLRTAMTLPFYETAGAYRGPVRIIQGTGDSLVPVSCAKRVHESIAGSELVLLPGLNHSYTQNLREAVDSAAEFLARELGSLREKE